MIPRIVLSGCSLTSYLRHMCYQIWKQIICCHVWIFSAFAHKWCFINVIFFIFIDPISCTTRLQFWLTYLPTLTALISLGSITVYWVYYCSSVPPGVLRWQLGWLMTQFEAVISFIRFTFDSIISRLCLVALYEIAPHSWVKDSKTDLKKFLSLAQSQ